MEDAKRRLRAKRPQKLPKVLDPHSRNPVTARRAVDELLARLNPCWCGAEVGEPCLRSVTKDEAVPAHMYRRTWENDPPEA